MVGVSYGSGVFGCVRKRLRAVYEGVSSVVLLTYCFFERMFFMFKSNCFSFDVSRDVANMYDVKSGLFDRRADFPLPIRSSCSSDKLFDLLMMGAVYGYEKACPPVDYVTVHFRFTDENLTVDDVRSMLNAVIDADCYYNLRIDGFFDMSRVYDRDGLDIGVLGFFEPYEVDENNVYLGPSAKYLASLSEADSLEAEREWEEERQDLHDRYYGEGAYC